MMQLNDLLYVVGLFVVIGIFVAIGISVQADVQADQTANSFAYNATGDAIEANVTVASYLPTIGLVVAAAILIGILLNAFVLKR